MNNYFRLSHFSDLHFHSFSLNPLLYCNKRFKGALRQIFNLPNFKPLYLLQRLPDLAKQLKIRGICITGDLTLTGLHKEFVLAQTLVQQFEKQDMIVEILPGNHDCYTKQDFLNQTFYKYFPNNKLQTRKIFSKKLSNSWLLVPLDCSYKNSCFTANGKVYAEQLIFLDNILKNSPRHNIIIANHYPLLPTHNDKHDLLNSEALLTTISRYKNVKLYLHGHDHDAEILTSKEIPSLIVNSGSTSLLENSSFYLFDLYSDKMNIQLVRLENIEDQSPLKYTITKETEVIF